MTFVHFYLRSFPGTVFSQMFTFGHAKTNSRWSQRSAWQQTKDCSQVSWHSWLRRCRSILCINTTIIGLNPFNAGDAQITNENEAERFQRKGMYNHNEKSSIQCAAH